MWIRRCAFFLLLGSAAVGHGAVPAAARTTGAGASANVWITENQAELILLTPPPPPKRASMTGVRHAWDLPDDMFLKVPRPNRVAGPRNQDPTRASTSSREKLAPLAQTNVRKKKNNRSVNSASFFILQALSRRARRQEEKFQEPATLTHLTPPRNTQGCTPGWCTAAFPHLGALVEDNTKKNRLNPGTGGGGGGWFDPKFSFIDFGCAQKEPGRHLVGASPPPAR